MYCISGLCSFIFPESFRILLVYSGLDCFVKLLCGAILTGQGDFVGESGAEV